MPFDQSQNWEAPTGPAPGIGREIELELTDVVLVPTAVATEQVGMPPVGFGERPPCLACGTVSRPLWGGVCAWCGGDEADLGI